jgi:BlaI family transcriptional regulator, penicillinase repressor
VADLPPTDRELQALKVLWKRGGATVREIWNLLRVGDANLAYTTVLSLLQVMEQKGLVEHRAEGKTYVYMPRVKRQNVFRNLAHGFLDKVFDGALDEYLVHALESRRPSAEEFARIEQMIAEAKKRLPRRPGEGRPRIARRGRQKGRTS